MPNYPPFGDSEHKYPPAFFAGNYDHKPNAPQSDPIFLKWWNWLNRSGINPFHSVDTGEWPLVNESALDPPYDDGYTEKFTKPPEGNWTYGTTVQVRPNQTLERHYCPCCTCITNPAFLPNSQGKIKCIDWGYQVTLAGFVPADVTRLIFSGTGIVGHQSFSTSNYNINGDYFLGLPQIRMGLPDYPLQITNHFRDLEDGFANNGLNMKDTTIAHIKCLDPFEIQRTNQVRVTSTDTSSLKVGVWQYNFINWEEEECAFDSNGSVAWYSDEPIRYKSDFTIDYVATHTSTLGPTYSQRVQNIRHDITEARLDMFCGNMREANTSTRRRPFAKFSLIANTYHLNEYTFSDGITTESRYLSTGVAPDMYIMVGTSIFSFYKFFNDLEQFEDPFAFDITLDTNSWSVEGVSGVSPFRSLFKTDTTYFSHIVPPANEGTSDLDRLTANRPANFAGFDDCPFNLGDISIHIAPVHSESILFINDHRPHRIGGYLDYRFNTDVSDPKYPEHTYYNSALSFASIQVAPSLELAVTSTKLASQYNCDAGSGYFTWFLNDFTTAPDLFRSYNARNASSGYFNEFGVAGTHPLNSVRALNGGNFSWSQNERFIHPSGV